MGETETAARDQQSTPLPEGADGVDDDGQLTAFDIPEELEPESPPLIDDDGRVRLSFSRIDSYRSCPAKFRFAYVDRLPGRPGPALSFGTSVHAALESFYDRKLPRCPTQDELLQFLYDAWETSGFAELDREQQIEYYRHAQDVLRRFHEREAPRYRLPAATEAWFELPMGDDALVVGSIDRVDREDDGSLRVIDYKTNRKVKDRTRVARSLQLAIYALACEHLYGQLPVSVALDFVVPGLTVEVPIEDIDLDRARRAVRQTAASVRDQAYEPEPSKLCHWCDFRAACPAWLGEGPDVLGPAQIELDQLRRRLRRDVEHLRRLEAGVERLRDELPVYQPPEELAAEILAEERTSDGPAAPDVADASDGAGPGAATG